MPGHLIAHGSEPIRLSLGSGRTTPCGVSSQGVVSGSVAYALRPYCADVFFGNPTGIRAARTIDPLSKIVRHPRRISLRFPSGLGCLLHDRFPRRST